MCIVIGFYNAIYTFNCSIIQQYNNAHKCTRTYTHSSMHTAISLLFLMTIFVVNGEWSSWTYGKCTKSCGDGTQKLTRKCNNPSSTCGGKDCIGLKKRSIKCNKHCCPGKSICMTVTNFSYISYIAIGVHNVATLGIFMYIHSYRPIPRGFEGVHI